VIGRLGPGQTGLFGTWAHQQQRTFWCVSFLGVALMVDVTRWWPKEDGWGDGKPVEAPAFNPGWGPR